MSAFGRNVSHVLRENELFERTMRSNWIGLDSVIYGIQTELVFGGG